MTKCFTDLSDALAALKEAGGTHRVYILTERSTGRKLYAVESSKWRAYGAAGSELGWDCTLLDPQYRRRDLLQDMLDLLEQATPAQRKKFREKLK